MPKDPDCIAEGKCDGPHPRLTAELHCASALPRHAACTLIHILISYCCTSASAKTMSYKIDDVRPKFELTHRNYVVTGGAQGIGFALTRAICEMGGNVAVWDVQARPVDEFNELSAKFGVRTLYIQTDVTQQDSLQAAMEETLSEFKSIDGCVPAAGIAIDKPFIEQTWDEFNRIQEINESISPCISCFANLSGSRNILHRSNDCQGDD